MASKYNFRGELIDKVNQMEEYFSYEVCKNFIDFILHLHSNDADDGAEGKRVDEVIRAEVTGMLEYCHGANRADITLKAKKKAVEVKTGCGELSCHFRTKEEAEQAAADFLAGGKLIKTRGYFIYQPIANPYDLGSAVVYPVEKFEKLIRQKECIVVKKATNGYYVISLQNYTGSKRGFERFLNWYDEGEVFCDWLFRMTGKY